MAERARSLASTGGNPRQFMNMASELVNVRTDQGSGKRVSDKSSYSTPGNPREFMEMAREFRVKTQQQGWTQQR